MTEVTTKQSRSDLWAYSRLGKAGSSMKGLPKENISGAGNTQRRSLVQANGRYMKKFASVAARCPRSKNRSKLRNTAGFSETDMTAVKTWNGRNVMDLPVRRIGATSLNNRASPEPARRKVLVNADELFGMYQDRAVVRFGLTWLDQS